MYPRTHGVVEGQRFVEKRERRGKAGRLGVDKGGVHTQCLFPVKDGDGEQALPVSPTTKTDARV